MELGFSKKFFDVFNGFRGISGAHGITGNPYVFEGGSPGVSIYENIQKLLRKTQLHKVLKISKFYKCFDTAFSGALALETKNSRIFFDENHKKSLVSLDFHWFPLCG